MLDQIANFFSSSAFMPHGHCYLWRPDILWLNVGSDLLIALAYYSIPFSLVAFIRKRRDLAFNWIFYLFAAFILACGTTHIVEILTTWRPYYGIQGLVKLATASVSVITAALLWPLIPKALALPSTAQLEESNRRLRELSNELEGRVAERTRELAAINLRVQQLNNELEIRVKERTEQLEAANRELEAFSYSVSHDLRAPLRGLDGFADILITRYAKVLDERGRHYLSRIKAASQRLSQLIDDMLNLSRLTRKEMRREEFDVGLIAEQIANDLKQSDLSRSVEFVIHRNAVVTADPILLRSALENLLGNAWKFTQKTAKAHIEFGIHSATQGNERVYYVKDNGAGFDMAYSNKLFGAFQRLHGADEFPGTGIGLASVQRIITRHGGQIWAEGAVNKGATFYFTLGS